MPKREDEIEQVEVLTEEDYEYNRTNNSIAAIAGLLGYDVSQYQKRTVPASDTAASQSVYIGESNLHFIYDEAIDYITLGPGAIRYASLAEGDYGWADDDPSRPDA